MRAIITGINGFVGRHLASYLIEKEYEVWGTTRQTSIMAIHSLPWNILSVDLNDENQLIKHLNKIRPDYIFHLSGQSSVKKSWENVKDTFQSNVDHTISLLEAIKKSDVSASVKIITVGSSEEYGKVPTDMMPIKESTPLQPISPYGVSKASVSMLAQHYYNAYGIRIVHARPFNHIGPMQRIGFVASDFAKQIAEIEFGLKAPLIEVGNLNSERDFCDVRDIVSAYESLLKNARFGEIYNVCSGKPVTIRFILEQYISFSTFSNIEVRENQALHRPVDYPRYYGDPTKIHEQTGWSNRIAIKQSLEDILNYWRTEISSNSKEYSRNV